MRRFRFPLLVLAFAAILPFVIGERNNGPDSLNYELMLRSLALDRDLFLANDLQLAGKPIFVTATGYPLDIHNAGVTLFWAPFYVVAHGFAILFGNAAGLGPIYTVWLRFADFLYGLLALGITVAAIRQRFPEAPAVAATLAVAAGSPFVYYMTAFSPSSHMVSAFLSALFLYGFLLDRDSSSVWMALGIVGGFALAVASTNIGLLVLPLVHFASSRRLGHAALFALFYALAFAPQMIVWWLFTGNPLRSPYSSQLSLSRPHLLEIAFSSYHGLYVYAPLLLLATAGLFLLWRCDRSLAAGSLLAIAASLYLGSSNLGWWGGASFGTRYLIGATPFFALGFAALPRKRAIGIAAAVCILWTFFLYLPYGTGAAALSTYYPLASQFHLIARMPRISISPLTLLFLPLFALLAAAGLHVRFDRLLARRELAALPIVLLAFMLFVVTRSEAARASSSNRHWIRADVDQWDLAYTYAERAAYHDARGDRAAAIEDMRTAVRIDPGDDELRRRLAALNGRYTPATP